MAPFIKPRAEKANSPAIRTASRRTVKTVNLSFGVGGAVALGLLILSATITLTELTARQSTLSVIDEQIERAQDDLAKASTPTTRQDTLGLAAKTARLGALTEARVLLKSLMGSGAASGTDLDIINRKVFNTGSADRYGNVKRGVLGSAWHGVLFSVAGLGNDTLMVLLLVACGGIGSGIAGIRIAGPRTAESQTLRKIVLGMAAGFVTLLALNGGKHVFLIQATTEGVVFDPYSSGLFAALGGLFTERAHTLIARLVEHFSNRIEEVVGTHAMRSAPGRADQPPAPASAPGRAKKKQAARKVKAGVPGDAVRTEEELVGSDAAEERAAPAAGAGPVPVTPLGRRRA